jgi:hypothetical protein
MPDRNQRTTPPVTVKQPVVAASMVARPASGDPLRTYTRTTSARDTVRTSVPVSATRYASIRIRERLEADTASPVRTPGGHSGRTRMSDHSMGKPECWNRLKEHSRYLG